jgi:hypothetical protein
LPVASGWQPEAEKSLVAVEFGVARSESSRCLAWDDDLVALETGSGGGEK